VSGKDGECVYQLAQDLVGAWQQQPLQARRVAKSCSTSRNHWLRVNYTLQSVWCVCACESVDKTVSTENGSGI